MNAERFFRRDVGGKQAPSPRKLLTSTLPAVMLRTAGSSFMASEASTRARAVMPSAPVATVPEPRCT
jgi:hypothetical protein